MGQTTIICTDTTIFLDSLDTQTYACPMSLDSLTHCIKNGLNDPARVISYVRHYPNIPVYLIGVIND